MKRYTFNCDLEYHSTVDVLAKDMEEARAKFRRLDWESEHPQPELVNWEITGVHSVEEA